MTSTLAGQRPNWSLHLLLVALLGIATGILFLQEPGFGDDLTYWTFGYDLHEVGMKAWGVKSFHDLRWPVWGWCWLIQSVGLTGMAAYTGVACVYLALGAMCAFVFGRILARTLPFAWACSIGFLFCPLIDNVCHRPMPDLSEGVIGAAIILAWWRLVLASTVRANILWAAVVGLGVFVMQANRLTGVFIAPVLLVITLLFARRKFNWLVVAGLFSLLFYGLECLFYKGLFDDWEHSLNANLQGKGKKGTANIPLITAPFRFVDTLWREANFSPVYCILALLGLWGALDRRRTLEPTSSQPVPERTPNLPAVLGVWLGVQYLMYACAPQSLSPWQPVIRDAGRFLAGLAMPLSLLAVLGLQWMLHLPRVRSRKWGRWIPEHPLAAGIVMLALLIATTSRPYFDLGFVAPMRAYLRTLQPGTKVFTHHMMRALALLSSPAEARKLQWIGPNNSSPKEIIETTPALEAMANASDEFWYMRKIVWMNTRKKLEDKSLSKTLTMGSYLENPTEKWALSTILVKGDGPDLVFYRRRTPEMAPPLFFTSSSPELTGLLPPLPATWIQKKDERVIKYDWKVPAVLRGKCLLLQPESTADIVEAVGITLKFSPPNKEQPELLMKPYTFPQKAKDFFVIPVPSDAETCAIQLRFSREVKSMTLSEFRVVVQAPLETL